jgi:Ca2+-binding EF-hand superfamily protein
MEEITQKNNLREQFEAIDEDGSGEVDQDELSKALEDLGYPVSRDELLMYFVDEDAEEEGALKDGIDFESFNKIIKG